MAEGLNELQVNMVIGIRVAPIPALRAFAGTGVKRRREPGGSREIGERLAKHLGHMHKFHEESRRVKEDDLADFLMQHLLAVPEALAKRVTDKNADVRREAIGTIAGALIDALRANWTVVYQPGENIQHGSGAKWHG
ncbi:hypothetical protein [Agrobacterium cavarae]|uniref:hypothetical protein n=1 Tax=Agrobacterium cavarae TaxID=2528239 RepID=UPI0028A10A85|nr:hypothetical protein [Agrobacterium cavarae]